MSRDENRCELRWAEETTFSEIPSDAEVSLELTTERFPDRLSDELALRLSYITETITYLSPEDFLRGAACGELWFQILAEDTAGREIARYRFCLLFGRAEDFTSFSREAGVYYYFVEPEFDCPKRPDPNKPFDQWLAEATEALEEQERRHG